MKPRILVACEFSGTVRDAFAARGWDAWSCDLLPSDAPGNHYQCDVREVLTQGWHLLIAHPPCTYLCGSGMHWTRRGLRNPQLTEDALVFVRLLLEAPVPHIALENPVGVISSRIRKPDQSVQPWQFGHDASKRTCLWLKNLPLLRSDSTKHVAPRLVPKAKAIGKSDRVRGRTGPEFLKRWGNQTDTGQNRLGPSDDRWAQRSITYPGIAKAFAEQWGDHVARKLNHEPTR